jgi:cytochrome c-type biogenesis protein CcsB
MRKNSVFLALLFIVIGCVPAAAASSADDAAALIPVQHNGRVKPFDSYARQTIRLLSGGERWKKSPSTTALLDVLSEPGRVETEPWIRIDFPELKEYLGLDKALHFFSLGDLASVSPKVVALVRSAKEKRDKDLRPSKLEQKAELLYGQLDAAGKLADGDNPAIVPSPDHHWKGPGSPSPAAEKFAALLEARREGRLTAAEVRAWSEAAHAAAPVDRARLKAETFYFRVHPFQTAAWLYVLSFLIFLFAKKRGTAGAAVAIVALAFHTAGLGLRVYVLARPPVSNMYESMIFMNWALMIFALGFAAVRKNSLPLFAGTLLSAVVMFYGDLLPIDSSLDVLVPVLRSNYWLSIHVMTIVASYGAFGLAMALGHRHLFREATGRFATAVETEDSAGLIYRIIQIGIVLIGTGTFLGGVWANESWGRFWGWDPKETWALITFLGYLLVVHLKFAKKIDAFGIALSSLLGFQLVLMTWYGVNFVLGRGLHSYGSGTGGMQWVIYYLVFEALFLAWALIRRRGARRGR